MIAPVVSDTHTERVEPGGFFHTYEFSIPAHHPSAAVVTEKAEVVFADADGVPRAFIVRSTSYDSSGQTKSAQCEDSAQDDLLASIQPPTNYTDDDGLEILTDLLAGTRWTPGVVESSESITIDSDTASGWMGYPTTWACVLDLSGRLGLEIVTRVEVVGNRIGRRYIDLVKSRGRWTGRVLRYARDTISMTRTGDGGEVYTRVIGIGKDGLTFASAVWDTGDGDPVDKPATQVWVADQGALEAYGIPSSTGLLHRTGKFEDSNETSAGRLLSKSWEYLQAHKEPQYSYAAQAVALDKLPPQRPGDLPSDERIRCGDTILVIDSEAVPPIRVTKRVVETRSSNVEPEQVEVVLGHPALNVSRYIASLR